MLPVLPRIDSARLLEDASSFFFPVPRSNDGNDAERNGDRGNSKVEIRSETIEFLRDVPAEASRIRRKRGS